MVVQRTGNPARKVVGTIFYVVIIGICLAVGAFIGWVGKSPTLQEFTKQQIFGVPPKEAFGNKDSLTVLILGIDERIYVNKFKAKVKTTEGGLSDMMMVAKIDFANNKIYGLSIPRDTEIRLLNSKGKYVTHKINAAHAIGGPELSKKVVEEILPGVKIDRTVVLNFDAFADAVNILGGVTMDVPKDMNYDDNWGDVHIHLKKGEQHLDGYNALMFARFRHSDSDFERQKRQKELMVALKDKMKEEWTKAPAVVDKSLDVAGNTFSAKEMASLMRFAKSLPDGSIEMGQLPVLEIKHSSNLKIDDSKLEDTLALFRLVPGLEPPKETPDSEAMSTKVNSEAR